jgi:hypothetical protein
MFNTAEYNILGSSLCISVKTNANLFTMSILRSTRKEIRVAILSHLFTDHIA